MTLRRARPLGPGGLSLKAENESCELPGQRYRRELRDLLVAALDFHRVPTSPLPTQNRGLRSDLILAAECVSDLHLSTHAPSTSQARAIWAEVADDILICLELGRTDQLRPTECGPSGSSTPGGSR